MTARQAGLALGLVHMALVGGVGGKLLLDRARLPRGWARAAPYDPVLPIRGRYVSLRLVVPLRGAPAGHRTGMEEGVRLGVVEGRVVGTPDSGGRTPRVRLEGDTATLVDPVAFFLPEHAADPSIRSAGEQLWAEVSLPPRGAPRPIRLGIRRNGTITPLAIP